MVLRRSFTHLLSACLLSCYRLAASCMQIVHLWPPVACRFWLILFMLHATGGHTCTICMWLAVNQVQFACNWRPLCYSLYTNKQEDFLVLLCMYFIQHCFICRPSDSTVSADAGIEIYIRLAARNIQILRPLAASCMQSCQFFASTLRPQLFELKIKDAVQKSESLRDPCAC